jgi:ferredoxin
MGLVWYWTLNAALTLLRLVPWRHKVGLIVLGQPGRGAPVLLTCNYALTVARVRRALKGQDCYLLVANSRGVNVWCAATGGLLTHHDVVAALKTSGIEALVDHRSVILPQLAATGVEAREVRARVGWTVCWGPADVKTLAGLWAGGEAQPFLAPALSVEGTEGGALAGASTPSLVEPTCEGWGGRQVTFPWQSRLEMAVAWAFPISLLVALALLFVWRTALVPAVLLCWALSLLVFLGFPLYARWLRPAGRGRGLSWERGGIQVALWVLCLLGATGYRALAGALAWGWLWRWALLCGVLALLVTVDLAGMTPLLKSGTQEERRYEVALDASRCRGDAVCVQVCPRGVFAVPAAASRRLVEMPGAAQCVRCGACIVQCPGDALSFVGPGGEVVGPETVRRCKLNMMGVRELGE